MNDKELAFLIERCREFADMCGTVPFIGTAKELLYQAADALELLQNERKQTEQQRPDHTPGEDVICKDDPGIEFDIKITKTLEGHVKIKADNLAAALSAAQKLYIEEGRELPEMEDLYPLQLSVHPSYFQKEKPPASTGEHPSAEEVEYYLIHQGYPHPSADLMDEFLNGGDKQHMYDEAVRNNYCLSDVDRWFHVNTLLAGPVSFRAAMMLDDAMLDEEYDLLDCSSAENLLDTEKQVCRNRIAFVMDVYKKDGTIVPNEWDITDQDVVSLSKTFEAVLSATPAQKRPLSSIIESADSKATLQDSSSQPSIPVSER